MDHLKKFDYYYRSYPGKLQFRTARSAYHCAKNIADSTVGYLPDDNDSIIVSERPEDGTLKKKRLWIEFYMCNGKLIEPEFDSLWPDWVDDLATINEPVNQKNAKPFEVQEMLKPIFDYPHNGTIKDLELIQSGGSSVDRLLLYHRIFQHLWDKVNNGRMEPFEIEAQASKAFVDMARNSLVRLGRTSNEAILNEIALELKLIDEIPF